VAAVPALAVPTRLSEDERSRHRDDFTLAVIKAHVLDTLEDLARPALPTLLTRGTTILDVGAGGGAIGGYLTRKYGVSVTAYDVVAPAQNVFSCPAASQLHRCSRQPVHVFDGATLPVADRSFDAVLFNSVLHHAAHNASGLLREAARVSSRWVIVIEDVTVRGERCPEERHIHRRHASHGAPANKGAARGIFRSQQEWVSLLQADGDYMVTRIGAVVARNLSREYRLLHRLGGDRRGELTGPMYQRFFVAERCHMRTRGGHRGAQHSLAARAPTEPRRRGRYSSWE